MSEAEDTSGLHGFDFLFGRWTVRHRHLTVRGRQSDQWEEITGNAETRPLLGGLCNIEEHIIPGQDFSGVALRAFDRASGRWSIYWVSARDGVLQAPVEGTFRGDEGLFEGADCDGGRPVKVRFIWRRLTPGSARWEQAFSYDDGQSWETNWIMQFERLDA